MQIFHFFLSPFLSYRYIYKIYSHSRLSLETYQWTTPSFTSYKTSSTYCPTPAWGNSWSRCTWRPTTRCLSFTWRLCRGRWSLCTISSTTRSLTETLRGKKAGRKTRPRKKKTRKRPRLWKIRKKMSSPVEFEKINWSGILLRLFMLLNETLMLFLHIHFSVILMVMMLKGFLWYESKLVIYNTGKHLQ